MPTLGGRPKHQLSYGWTAAPAAFNGLTAAAQSFNSMVE